MTLCQLRLFHHSLDPLFNPSSVAFIGAKEEMDSVGRTVIANLRQPRFLAPLYLINPKHTRVMGLPCLPSISAVEEPVDLSIIATPAPTVPKLILECKNAKVKAVIILSAKFNDPKVQEELNKAVAEVKATSTMRILGPNCLGVIAPHADLNASFAPQSTLLGSLAFISQSGAMCTAVLDWSLRKKFGFSGFVSIGSMCDIAWADLLDYFGKDEKTSSILIYMESIGNARDFLAVAKKVARVKPIILIKAGKTEAAATAATSHTGALAGNDAAFEAAMRRIGVLRVNTISELFDMALVLSKQPRPSGPHLTILTNAGGPAILATDAALLSGASLTELGGETMQKLEATLPAGWSRANPIDLMGDATPEHFQEALEILKEDPITDALLVILTRQSVTKPKNIAEVVQAFAAAYKKPIFASWMGSNASDEAVKLLQEGGIPTFAFPDNAAHLFAKMWRHSVYLKDLYQTSCDITHDIVEESAEKKEEIHQFLQEILHQGRTLLTESESKKLLTLYGLNCIRTEVATTENEAVQRAEELGWPVVLKLNSKTVTHKSDKGGVKLNLSSTQEVHQAFKEIQAAFPNEFDGVSVQPMKVGGYELILGSSIDAEFGPILLFGMGGQLVEILSDTVIGLPPLTVDLANRLIAQTRISKAFKGVRGKPAIHQEALSLFLVRFSHMMAQQPLIKECDINPLLATDQEVIALDARIVLQQKEVPSQLAIRPYPIHYSSSWNGWILRLSRSSDIEALTRFCKEHQLPNPSELGFQLAYCDWVQEFTLIAYHEVDQKLSAVAHLEKLYGTQEAFLWIISPDELLLALLDQVKQIATQEQLSAIRMRVDTRHPQWPLMAPRLSFDSPEQAGWVNAFLTI